MYADISKPPAPLPSAKLKPLQHGVSLLTPLSRKGQGPGLILLTTPDTTDETLTITDAGPSPLVKWSEEGYVTCQISSAGLSDVPASDLFSQALSALEECEKCQPKEKIGLVAYSGELWNKVASSLTRFPSIAASVVYTDAGEHETLASAEIPVLRHIAGKAGQPPLNVNKSSLVEYFYPNMSSHRFVLPNHVDFHYSTDAVAHTRNLQFLKPRMDGPYFDLESIWDEHTYYEFKDRSVEHTVKTMVQEAYVNHVPTLTGGIGQEKLTSFYRNNFIFLNSADTELELISRTVGIDRVIDEFIFKFTHDREIDWLLPGVPPTNLKAEVPFTAVVNIRGDRLYHEHITWDQGTTLRQLGLMPEYLPFPYALPDGRTAPEGSQFEYRVPVAGLDTARKMQDRNSVASNQMFEFKIRESKKPQ